MSTFVLVHGAMHGGWCRRDVRERLEAEGHVVCTPTLTGQGERRHLLTPDVGIDTHVDDLVETLWFEDLRDVVLALHSHAGVFPLRCCTDPTVFDETALQAVPRSYVQHTDPPLASLELSVPRATSDGCAVHHVACGHDMMIERPQEVAQLLRAIGHSAPD